MLHPSTFHFLVLMPVAFVAFPPTMLEHFLVFEDWTQQLGVCDIWAGNREHPSSLLPLCQPRARQLLRSKEDPLMPTITQYVAFLFSYINFMLQAIHHFAEWSQCCYSYNAMQLLFMLDTLNHSWLFWFGFGCNSMPLLEHPSDLWSPTVCVYCDSFFFFQTCCPLKGASSHTNQCWWGVTVQHQKDKWL